MYNINFNLNKDNLSRDKLSFNSEYTDNYWANFNNRLTTVSTGSYNFQTDAEVKPKSSSTSTQTGAKAVANLSPQALQFTTDKLSYLPTETVNLTRGSVFDANGVTDLARVDFWLQKDGENWQDISDAISFTTDTNDKRLARFNYSLTGLGTGNYQLKAVAYDKTAANSNTCQVGFSIVASNDLSNLSIKNAGSNVSIKDAGIQTLLTSRFADNQLDRNDIISIFREAGKDDGIIDANEQLDLGSIVSNSSHFNMPDYVRFLSTQVANKINTNMSQASLESLIGRNFFGSDTPQHSFTDTSYKETTNFSHATVQGKVFGSSGRANINDISQGILGNCAFLASLGAVVNYRPDIISNMIIDNGDNTYTIRFYSATGGASLTASTPGSAEYVTVDRRLATDQDGRFLFANYGDLASDSNNILWVGLVERAYAQWQEFFQGYVNGYDRIGNGDLPQLPLAYITGAGASDRLTNKVSFAEIQAALTSSHPVTAWGYNSSTYIAAGHCYSVTSAYVNSSGEQRVVVYNPWGTDTDGNVQVNGADDGYVDLSFSQFASALSRINFLA